MIKKKTNHTTNPPPKHRITVWSSNSIPLLAKRSKQSKAGAQADVCPPVFIATFIYIAKVQKQTECPWKDGEGNSMVRPYNGVLFRLPEEGSSRPSCTVVQVNCNKPVTKGQTLCGSTCGRSNSETESGAVVDQGQRGGGVYWGQSFWWARRQDFCRWRVAMAAQQCECT